MDEARLPPPSLPARLQRFEELHEIIRTLRSPNGCPWDREQTHESLRKYLLEEAYEAVEAIDRRDPHELRDELGDVLLQIMLHSQIASETGEFEIDDVMANLSAKMIRRHPHVFGTLSVDSSAEVVQNWEAIKAAEKPDTPRTRSVLDGIPREYPALMKAAEVSRRVVKVGFEWEKLDDVWAKVREEVAELEAASLRKNQEEMRDEIGDLLFTLVNVARWMKVDPEESLRRMVDRFSARFRYMEERVESDNRDIEALTLEEMETLWREAKEEERKSA